MHHKYGCVNLIGRSWRTWKMNQITPTDLKHNELTSLCRYSSWWVLVWKDHDNRVNLIRSCQLTVFHPYARCGDVMDNNLVTIFGEFGWINKHGLSLDWKCYMATALLLSHDILIHKVWPYTRSQWTGEPAASYRWIGRVWEITGWNSKL